jgi:hypothetical protein
LPDKNGYQSSVAGTDKHKYGYELKENKHFHHTTTEKVRSMARFKWIFKAGEI